MSEDVFNSNFDMTKWDKRSYLEGHSWGPGSYSCKCFKCGKVFVGEKHATECAPCAYGDEAQEKVN